MQLVAILIHGIDKLMLGSHLNQFLPRIIISGYDHLLGIIPCPSPLCSERTIQIVILLQFVQAAVELLLVHFLSRGPLIVLTSISVSIQTWV